MGTPFHSIEDAIRDIKNGKFIILVDDEDRENEGDPRHCRPTCDTPGCQFSWPTCRGLICR